jgi:dTDP-glucose 4,6-dehydratase
MRVLLTGGVGFIGHHFVEHILKNTDWEIVLLDRLDLSGNLNRLTDIIAYDYVAYTERLKWIYHDLKAPINNLLTKQIGSIDAIFHLAASTHVDRSITDPLSFVYDNVVGTCNVLEFAKLHNHRKDFRMLYFSTDEVFGPAVSGAAYKEWSRYKSGNPYAATKAGAEELCLAYHNTFGLNVMISHCMNVFGERQHPEKFIPLVIQKIRDNEVVGIHSNKDKTVPGSRFYIHARNVAAASLFILKYGRPGEKYNIVGELEINNLDLAYQIAMFMSKPLKYELVDFHSSRPGHDLRYALNGSKMITMGWKLPLNFYESLEKTVRWSLSHPQWLG